MDVWLSRLVDEFDLGTLGAVTPLSGGSAEVVRLDTTRGSFVVKPVWPTFDGDFYATVARTLNARGIRQPDPVRSRSGATLSSTGHFVMEWLHGEIVRRPSSAQSDALLRHLAAYDEALREIPVPATLAADDTVFAKVVSPQYLLARLPELFRSFAPAGYDSRPVLRALAALEPATPEIAALPVQVVHGDVAPDNVLYDGDDVVAVIDFTPFRESLLFGVCTALYWYHVIDHPNGLATARISSGLSAYAERRPWSERELRLWPVLLIREALRRLATPLAGTEKTGGPVPAARFAKRYAAVTALVDAFGPHCPGVGRA